MAYLMRLFLALLTCILLGGPIHAQRSTTTMESLINEHIPAYSISLDNQFKLAAYAELKGRVDGESGTLFLPFGSLGHMTFYPRNCLIKTSQQQVFHLNRGEAGSINAASIDVALNDLFEKILLLGNYDASPAHAYFVNQFLSRKNLEPFDKIYLRHILIRYGRFYPEERAVEFHSDWLPERTYSFKRPGDSVLVTQPVRPLRIRLDENILKGYYIMSGATVYVEDVDYPVEFASGETYGYNVSAFKLFLQKLFIQSVQHVVEEEVEYLKRTALREAYIPLAKAKPEVYTPSDLFVDDKHDRPLAYASRPSTTRSAKPRRNKKKARALKVEPLYHAYSWIPMMLGLLRARDINIGEPDVIRYFVDAPYFDRLYDQLTDEERIKVDAFRTGE